jgi:hypothetical protein
MTFNPLLVGIESETRPRGRETDEVMKELEWKWKDEEESWWKAIRLSPKVRVRSEK